MFPNRKRGTIEDFLDNYILTKKEDENIQRERENLKRFQDAQVTRLNKFYEEDDLDDEEYDAITERALNEQKEQKALVVEAQREAKHKREKRAQKEKEFDESFRFRPIPPNSVVNSYIPSKITDGQIVQDLKDINQSEGRTAKEPTSYEWLGKYFSNPAQKIRTNKINDGMTNCLRLVNQDKSGSGHWVADINFKIYDSFGELKVLFPKRKIGNPGMMYQAPDSSTCGAYALLFLLGEKNSDDPFHYLQQLELQPVSVTPSTQKQWARDVRMKGVIQRQGNDQKVLRNLDTLFGTEKL